MIHRRAKGIANIYVLLLVVLANLVWHAAGTILYGLREGPPANLLPMGAYFVAVTLGTMTSWRSVGQMGPDLMLMDWARALRLGARQTAGVIVTTFAFVVLFKDPGLSRIFIGTYAAALWVLFSAANRSVPRLLARRVFSQDRRVRTLIAGQPGRLASFRNWLDRQEYYGTDVVGIVPFPQSSANVETDSQHGAAPVFENLQDALQQSDPDQVIVLSDDHPVHEVRTLMNASHHRGIRVYLYDNYAERLGVDMRPVNFDGRSFLALSDEPLEDPFNRWIKRAMDLLIAVPATLVLLPPLALIILLLQQFQSPGPLFFRQPRTGRRGAPFTIYKFRSMHLLAVGQMTRPGFDHNSRTYPFGAFLRRSSLDEIPQLLNVIAGDMSIVGPRPHLSEHDKAFAETVSVYRMRFSTKPGITGLAQSRGFRGEATDAESIEGRINLDLAYIRGWSIWLDLAIIARTVRTMLFPPPSAQ